MRLIVEHKERLFNGWLWKLYQPFIFNYYGDLITIPKGFNTDFASVPKWLWSFIPSIGNYCEASLVHDYLYTIGYGNRKKADDLFIKAMLQKEPNKYIRAYVMYYAVRLFGGSRWNKNKWNKQLNFV